MHALGVIAGSVIGLYLGWKAGGWIGPLRLRAMAVIVTATLLAILAAGCESPAAQRESARAERVRAEADAYTRKVAADTDAAAERAALRQIERDAAHERTLEMLPFVLSVGGGVLLLCLALFLWWDVRSQRQASTALAEPRLAAHEWAEVRRALEQRDRMLWHALALLARRLEERERAQLTNEKGRF